MKNERILTRTYYRDPSRVRYYCRIAVGRDPWGKPVYKEVSDFTEDGLRRKIAEVKKKKRVCLISTGITMHEYAKRIWQRDKEDQRSSVFRLFLEITEKDLLLEKLDLQRAYVIMERLEKSDRSDHCKRETLRFLQTVEKEALSEHYLTLPMFCRMRLPKRMIPAKDILEKESCERIMAEDPGRAENAWLQIALHCSGRPAEISGLMKTDFKEMQGLVSIRRQLKEKGNAQKKDSFELCSGTKNHRIRDIRAAQVVFDIVKQREAVLARERENAGRDWTEFAEGQLLFVDEKGLPVRRKQIVMRLREILKDTPDEDADLRILRRTGLTRLYSVSGYSRDAVLRQSGESDFYTLLHHYLIIREDDKKAIAEKMDQYFREVRRDNGSDQ